MPNFANLFTPSTETIQGVANRTGMNLPDLPYGGILSLLTGGAGGFLADNLVKTTAPKIAEAFNSTVANGLRNADIENKNTQQEYRDTILDAVLGKLPEVDMTGAYGGMFDPQDWYGANQPDNIDVGDGWSAAQTALPEMPNMDLNQMLGNTQVQTPSLNMPTIGSDWMQAPELNNFQYEAPAFDTYEWYSRGGKV